MKHVSAKVWLDLGDGVAFCHGKAELLSAIDAHGSINRAAAAIEMSYKRAWQYIRQVEKQVGSTVLDTQIGGRGGGGSRLTETGRALLREYADAKQQVSRSLTENVRAFKGAV